MRDGAKLQHAGLDMVQQAAGRGDEDVDALFKGADLRRMTDAAIDERMADAEKAAILTQLGVDLDRQFAGRSENQSAHALRLEPFRATRELLQEGKPEGCGLARSGLRDAEHVATFEKGRDGLRLDRRRGHETRLAERAQQRFGESQIRKRVQLIQEKGLTSRMLSAFVGCRNPRAKGPEDWVVPAPGGWNHGKNRMAQRDHDDRHRLYAGSALKMQPKSHRETRMDLCAIGRNRPRDCVRRLSMHTPAPANRPISRADVDPPLSVRPVPAAAPPVRPAARHPPDGRGHLPLLGQ